MGLARWHAGALAYMGRDGIVVWQGERGKRAGVSMGSRRGLLEGLMSGMRARLSRGRRGRGVERLARRGDGGAYTRS